MVELSNYNNDAQDKLLINGGGDQEMGHLSGGISQARSEKVGPYQFVWADGADSYNGAAGDNIDATDVPSRADENEPLLANDHLQMAPKSTKRDLKQDQLALQQPHFVEEQSRTFFQKFCCCCIRASLREDRLSSHELRCYQQI